MTTANERQVGGSHYAAAMQHWDFAYAAFGEGYFKGQITKYVSRWRKKNGIQDLEKARHFLQKLIELQRMEGRWARMLRKVRSNVLFAKRAQLADDYEDHGGISIFEAEIIWLVTVDRLHSASLELDWLIREQTLLAESQMRELAGSLAGPQQSGQACDVETEKWISTNAKQRADSAAEPTRAYVHQDGDGDGDNHARIL